MSIIQELKSRFRPALSSFTDDADQFVDMIRASQDTKHGDFQANFAMPLGKKAGKPPRDVAQEICDAADLSDMADSTEVAGPGFINIRLKQSWLESQLQAQLDDDRCGVKPIESAKHFIVDFSSPNVAKPMHVGHLRSTVIGDSICKILRFLGHKVTSDNHIGDWGTQFGMIIYGYKHFVNEAALAEDMVGELSRLYRLVNTLSDYHTNVAKLPKLQAELETKQGYLAKQEAEADPNDKKAKKALKKLRAEVQSLTSGIESTTVAVATIEADAELKSQAEAHPDIARNARNETAKLHAGDDENNALWNRFLPECLKTLQAVYDRLDIEFDLTLGESYYQPKLGGVVESLKAKAIAAESDGAMCVFVDGNDAPFIVQKADGAFTYGTTDLATIEHRVKELEADEALYVVDSRQSEHFDLLFKTADKWGYTDIKLNHVKFGTVMDRNNRPYKTRSGDTVGLMGLLDEAVTRAEVVVRDNDAKRQVLSEDEIPEIAEVVGLGGVKYFDLMHDRESDYKFSWEDMLATNGNTATYCQYAYARVRGIAAKCGVDPASLSGDITLGTDPERALAIMLLQFDEAVSNAATGFRPHLLAGYLFETAKSYSVFFDKCPVKNAEDEATRISRLLLCELTARVLKQGLALLGIKTAERM